MMLQKLENAYLAILRFVVIAVAGGLLIAVVILGFNSMQAIQSAPVAEKITPYISDQELIKDITEKSADETKQVISQSDAPKADPNRVYYERTAKAIINFVSKYSNGTESVEQEQIINVSKSKAEAFDEDSYTTAYAQGFAESIEKTLEDPTVIKIAQETSTLEVVNKALDRFTSKFNAQIDTANITHAEKQQQYIEKKAKGVESLYVAAGALAAFLAIVFLSIIIRIERNLRHLENRASTQV